MNEKHECMTEHRELVLTVPLYAEEPSTVPEAVGIVCNGAVASFHVRRMLEPISMSA